MIQIANVVPLVQVLVPSKLSTKENTANSGEAAALCSYKRWADASGTKYCDWSIW